MRLRWRARGHRRRGARQRGASRDRNCAAARAAKGRTLQLPARSSRVGAGPTNGAIASRSPSNEPETEGRPSNPATRRAPCERLSGARHGRIGKRRFIGGRLELADNCGVVGGRQRTARSAPTTRASALREGTEAETSPATLGASPPASAPMNDRLAIGETSANSKALGSPRPARSRLSSEPEIEIGASRQSADRLTRIRSPAGKPVDPALDILDHGVEPTAAG